MSRTINATIEDIVFRNDDNGYSVLNLNYNNSQITAVGIFPVISEGQNVIAVGNFVSNSKFGEQFKVESVKVNAPTTANGIKKYLSSGLIRGIGEARASAIVNNFKEDTLNIIEYAPMRLTEIKGISAKKAQEIADTVLSIKQMQDAVIYLQSLNISINLAIKIYNLYLTKTIETVQNNPYKLVEDIDGVGFLTADKIASEMGISKNSEFRLRAGLIYSLKESLEKTGSTYIKEKTLIKNAYNLLGLIDEDYVEKLKFICESFKIEGVFKGVKIEDEMCFTTNKFYNFEKSIASLLINFAHGVNYSSTNFDDIIAQYELKNKIKLHNNQKSAIKTALENNFCVITGGPGTGKTTIIKCIVECLKHDRKKILLLAPTGRAAKRLSSSTNHEAKTIHRAIDLDFTNGARAQAFSYDVNNKLAEDVIIVDEVSMMDSALCYHLLKVVKKTAKIIFVGDKDQLPSVGCGNVLSDIIKSKQIPVEMLTYIYRQDEKSSISSNAHLINNGEMPVLENSNNNDFFYENKQEASDILNCVIGLITKRLPKFLNVDANKIQVLCAVKNGVCGVENINKKLQEIINPPSNYKTEVIFENSILREGDKVMHTVNNYNLEWQRFENCALTENGKGVFNGDIGYIKSINRQTFETEIEFEDNRIAKYVKSDLNQLILSYAITVHKSQGSEFDAMVMPIVGGAPMLCTRNLLYTALTRAKKLAVLVGKKQNIKYMIDNNFTQERFTMLKYFLEEENIKFNQLYNYK